LDEKLKREGTKTHKERVEELNRYLSNLSEHHDMYVPNWAEATLRGEQDADYILYTGQGLDPDKDR